MTRKKCSGIISISGGSAGLNEKDVNYPQDAVFDRKIEFYICPIVGGQQISCSARDIKFNYHYTWNDWLALRRVDMGTTGSLIY